MPESFTCHQCHRPQRIGRRHWTKYQPVYSEGATKGRQAVGNCICLHVNNYWRLWLLMVSFWCVSEDGCLSAHLQWVNVLFQQSNMPVWVLLRHSKTNHLQPVLRPKSTATEKFHSLCLHSGNNRVQTWVYDCPCITSVHMCMRLWVYFLYGCVHVS